MCEVYAVGAGGSATGGAEMGTATPSLAGGGELVGGIDGGSGSRKMVVVTYD